MKKFMKMFKKMFMKKNHGIIYLLPQFEGEATFEAIHEHFLKIVEFAATVDYVPTSLEELRRIDDLKLLMDYNPRFYNAAVALCDDLITQMIEDAKKLAAEEELECGTLEDVETLDDLINSGFFGDNPDYDERRFGFICTLLNCYLFA